MLAIIGPNGILRRVVFSTEGEDLENCTVIEWNDAAKLIHEPPPPKRRLAKSAFMDLWTPAETIALIRTTDDNLSFFWARLLSWDGEVPLAHPRIVAGIERAVTRNILSRVRADRILAGLPPE